MDEQTNNDNDIQDAINDIEKCLNGKHSQELKALKNVIKILKMEHKIEIQARDIEIMENKNQLKDKEIQIKANTDQILKLENENKLLKMKTNDIEEETTPLKNEKQIKSYLNMNTDDLLTDGIAKFPLIEKLSNSYQEWFGVMTTRLDRNYPYIFEKFVLVKVNCKNSKDRYYFYSRNENIFYDQVTNLDIYNKGFRHETTTVSILHPNFVNKSIQMLSLIHI